MDLMLDCHTHHKPPYPLGIVNIEAGETLVSGQNYSIGLHPWYVSADFSEALAVVERVAADARVLAVGEAGLDSCCATPMWLQVKAFVAQINIAERLRKPLMVHCVRCVQEIVQLRRELHSEVPWVIHGFRGKPSLLEMLLKTDCYVSFGEYFNEESLRRIPPSHILAETDESVLSITEIIDRLSAARGEDLYPIIVENTSKVFGC